MAEYQLTATDSIIRTADGACIPADMANQDYNGSPKRPGYLQWVEAGGVPDPYVPPPEPEPSPTPAQAVLFDHENRIRGFEGREPISVEDFTKELASK
jgi:hypothetical protein